jgi:integrase
MVIGNAQDVGDDEGFTLFSDEKVTCFAGKDTPTSSLNSNHPYAPKSHIDSALENPVQLGFGHRRLAIIDLSAGGHQPMCLQNNQRIWITLNGEIYNYIELREELRSFGYTFHTESDVEVVLVAYQHWQTECLTHFNGMWSFVLYDIDKNRLFGARDRFGVKPLYYLHNEKHFEFPMSLKNYFKTLNGSEAIKAVLNKEEVNKLYAFKLDNKKHCFIRDLFVFSCFTGMRWDDMITFNKKDVHIQQNGVKMIEKMAKKTKEWYRVPINSIVSEIIERYNYNFNRENNPTFNEQLKIILILTEWFKDETKFKDDDGNFLPRWQCISVHRGRDTFITMLVNNRVPLNEIMKYTGHKTVTSLNMYIDKKAEINDYTSELVIS